jgi:hypothetical protein
LDEKKWVKNESSVAAWTSGSEMKNHIDYTPINPHTLLSREESKRERKKTS